MTGEFAVFAAPQRVFQLLGLCTPFWESKLEDRSGERLEYIPGCARLSIQRGHIELLLEHQFFEYLADQKHQTLTVFEQPSGIYFRAELPETPFTRELVKAIDRGVIRHLCNHGTTHTKQSTEPNLWSVYAYDIHEISLLVSSAPCFASTWVMRDGLEARQRIADADARCLEWYQRKLKPAETVSIG